MSNPSVDLAAIFPAPKEGAVFMASRYIDESGRLFIQPSTSFHSVLDGKKLSREGRPENVQITDDVAKCFVNIGKCSKCNQDYSAYATLASSIDKAGNEVHCISCGDKFFPQIDSAILVEGLGAVEQANTVLEQAKDEANQLDRDGVEDAIQPTAGESEEDDDFNNNFNHDDDDDEDNHDDDDDEDNHDDDDFDKFDKEDDDNMDRVNNMKKIEDEAGDIVVDDFDEHEPENDRNREHLENPARTVAEEIEDQGPPSKEEIEELRMKMEDGSNTNDEAEVITLEEVNEKTTDSLGAESGVPSSGEQHLKQTENTTMENINDSIEMHSQEPNTSPGAGIPQPVNDATASIAKLATVKGELDDATVSALEGIDWKTGDTAVMQLPAGNFLLIHNDEPVARFNRTKAAADIAAIWNEPAFEHAVSAAVKRGLSKEDIARLGVEAIFKPMDIETAKKVSVGGLKRISDEALAQSIADYQESFKHALAIATTAAVKNVYGDKANILRDGLVSELSRVGVFKPENIVDSVLSDTAETFFAGVVQHTFELVEKPANVRNEIAMFVDKASFKTPTISHGEKLSEQLSRGSLRIIGGSPSTDTGSGRPTEKDLARFHLASIARLGSRR